MFVVLRGEVKNFFPSLFFLWKEFIFLFFCIATVWRRLLNEKIDVFKLRPPPVGEGREGKRFVDDGLGRKGVSVQDRAS